MIEAELHDGTVLEFPDGTPQEVVIRTVKQLTVARARGAADMSASGGFGSRGRREQDMPVTPELQREVNIAKRMANRRELTNTGAGNTLIQGFSQNLNDEAGALASGLAGGVRGALRGDFSDAAFTDAYSESKEAAKRILQEYAEKNPGRSLAAQLAGGFASGTGARSAATTLPGRILEQGKQGAILGGIAGAGEGEGWGRVTGAGTGAALGAAIGAGVPALTGGAAAAGQGVRNTIRSALNPEAEAARRIAEAGARDAAVGGFDAVAAQRAGQPAVLMDRGTYSTGLARSAANQSPEARTAIEATIRPRFATQVERLDDVLKGQSTLGGSADDFVEAAKAAARAANRPLYQKAYGLGGKVWSSELQDLVSSSPAMRQALKSAIAKSADNAVVDGYRGMNPSVLLDEAGNLKIGRGGMDLGAYPDLRVWDLTKRELDRMAKMAGRASDSDARTFEQLSKRLTAHLDSLGDMGKAYKAARQSAASFFGAEDAFTAGQKFASSKGMSMRDAIKGVVKMKPEERKLFREGYIRAMRDQMAELRDNRDATINILTSPGQRERARVALGRAGADRLEAQVTVEKAMDAARQAMGNSTTVRQWVELGMSGAGGGILGAGTGGVLGGDPFSMSMGAILGSAGRAGRTALNQRVSSHVGRLITSNDPVQVQRLIQLAARSPAYLDAVRRVTKALTMAGAAQASGAVGGAASRATAD